MRSRQLMILAAGVLAFGSLSAAPAMATGSFTVNTKADTVDAKPGDGTCADSEQRCSLRAAVQEANASGGGTIALRGGKHALTIAGAGEDASATGDLDITSKITISGNGATIDAGGMDRVLHVAPGATLNLKAAKITGGVAEGTETPANSGGGVLNAGSLVVDRGVITGNSATRAGGGIEASANSSTTVRSSMLSDNSTGPMPGNGGALHITESGTVKVERSFVIGNSAAQEGGGLWNDAGSTMTVTGSVLKHNNADGTKPDDGGGALFNNGGEMVLENSLVAANRAAKGSGSGGGAFNLDGTFTANRSAFVTNQAVRAGGGVEANLGETTLESTTLLGNRTGANPGNGGGLHLTGAGTVKVNRGAVLGNRAANEGGGLWNDAGGTMTVTRTAIALNSAPVGRNNFQKAPDGDFTIDGRPVPPTPAG